MSQDKSVQDNRLLNIYRWSVILLGAAALVKTLLDVDFSSLGYSYIIFAATTIVLASRITVQIPRTKGHISVSDTFIFLSILLYGGEAGILLATADAIAPAYKLAKTRTTLAFNIAVFAIATSATVWSNRFIFGTLKDYGQGQFTSKYIAVLCMMGLVQYIVNSGLIATGVALRAKKPIWQMWKDNFLWTSITYFAGVSAAGIIAKLIVVLGIYAFMAAIPIIAIIYFTYTTYLKNVETVSEQAEQAQKHVEELSHHIAEQERIGRALKESEEYFRNAFDHAAGMAVINPEGKWMQVNESLCSMLGYTEEELLKEGFQAITHPQDLGNDLANLYQLLDGKIPSYQLEKRYSHKTGTNGLGAAKRFAGARCRRQIASRNLPDSGYFRPQKSRRPYSSRRISRRINRIAEPHAFRRPAQYGGRTRQTHRQFSFRSYLCRPRPLQNRQ